VLLKLAAALEQHPPPMSGLRQGPWLDTLAVQVNKEVVRNMRRLARKRGKLHGKLSVGDAKVSERVEGQLVVDFQACGSSLVLMLGTVVRVVAGGGVAVDWWDDGEVVLKRNIDDLSRQDFWWVSVLFAGCMLGGWVLLLACCLDAAGVLLGCCAGASSVMPGCFLGASLGLHDHRMKRMDVLHHMPRRDSVSVRSLVEIGVDADAYDFIRRLYFEQLNGLECSPGVCSAWIPPQCRAVTPHMNFVILMNATIADGASWRVCCNPPVRNVQCRQTKRSTKGFVQAKHIIWHARGICAGNALVCCKLQPATTLSFTSWRDVRIHRQLHHSSIFYPLNVTLA
jgi:hypothetical protein